jgi:hypothetical protein
VVHLTSEATLNLIEGRLSTSERKGVTEHIEGCESCSREVAEWRRFHSLLRRAHLESAPADLIDQAWAIFGANEDLQRTNIPEIAAVIVFDSFKDPALAGTRGTTEPQHVMLRASEFDIHLKISANPSQRQMMGQVFARDDTEFLSSVRLHLLQNGQPFQSTWTDNFGQFQFDEVPQGAVSLQVELPHLTIVGAIVIGQRGV